LSLRKKAPPNYIIEKYICLRIKAEYFARKCEHVCDNNLFHFQTMMFFFEATLDVLSAWQESLRSGDTAHNPEKLDNKCLADFFNSLLRMSIV